MKVLALSLTLLTVISQIYASCVCRNGGSTLCACSPSYVKPQPKPHVPNAQEQVICKKVSTAPSFKPTGDICSCGSVHVAPTPVKPTACSLTTHTQTSHTQNQNQLINLVTYEKNTFRDVDHAINVYASNKEAKASKNFAADALSVHLALEQHDRCNEKVPESKLHYGPTGKIINVLKTHKYQDLKEGELYKLNGRRIALKGCKVKQADEIEEEPIDDEPDTPEPYKLTYTDLGFGDAHFPPHEFVRHHAVSKSYSGGGGCKDKDQLHKQKVEFSSCSCQQKSHSVASDYHVYQTVGFDA